MHEHHSRTMFLRLVSFLQKFIQFHEENILAPFFFDARGIQFIIIFLRYMLAFLRFIYMLNDSIEISFHM